MNNEISVNRGKQILHFSQPTTSDQCITDDCIMMVYWEVCYDDGQTSHGRAVIVGFNPIDYVYEFSITHKRAETLAKWFRENVVRI